MFRRFCGVQASRHRRDLAAAGFTPAEDALSGALAKPALPGVQVPMPISELKAWLTEKMAF